jgi:hypothetical protein
MQFPRLDLTYISGLLRDDGVSKICITIIYEERVRVYEYRGLPEGVIKEFLNIPIWNKDQQISYFNNFIKDQYPNQVSFDPADQDILTICDQALNTVTSLRHD